tara:strand:+ start:296 stop:1021 length:726 start_codon:yes stop_codon:yes gene_type:complete
MVEQVQVEGNVTGSEAPTEEATENRPEWLPEKFKSPEDLAKGYSELEKQFTQSRQEASATKEETAEEETNSDARETVEKAGLDFDSMQQEFAEKGNLSAETYSELESKGIPKEMVDAYVEGQQAKADAYTNELYEFAGGEEPYKEMSQWASENLTNSEIDAFNDSISSGNQSQARLAIDGIISRYRANGGAEPTLVGGKASSSVDIYNSWAQVTKDMATPDYKKDPAFRDAVQKKLSRSNI